MGEYYNDFRNCQTLEDLKIRLNRFFESFFSEIDSLNVIKLNTNKTRIKSENGETYINGPMLEMSDDSGTMRLKQGLDLNTMLFVFQMFNNAGLLTVDIDSSGNLVVENGTFKGDIATTKDAHIGQNLYLNNTAAAVNKGIYFFSDGTPGSITIGGGTAGLTSSSDYITLNAGVTTTINYLKANGGVGFFGTGPVGKTFVTQLTSATAGASYTASEQTMLNNLNSTVRALISALNGYGLI